MKRGRPRDEYPQAEFRGAVLGVLAERSLGLRGLETLSGVNRGTLSAILRGKRPCERKDRAAILHALGFDPEAQARFLSGRSAPAAHDRILLDGRVSPHPRLQRGQEFMSRSQFPEARQEFKQVYEQALAAGDLLEQADAAAWLAWFNGELERFEEACRWTWVSIRLIEGYLGVGADRIIDSISGSQFLNAASAQAIQILSRALRVYSKVVAVRIVHYLEFDRLPEAQAAFRRSLRLDERLQLPELAHGLRWRAVALSAEDGSRIGDVESFLGRSRELLSSGSPGEACLIREQGIIRWQKNRLAKAADFLWDAKEKLTLFADARALGPTFCVLSKLIAQDSGDFKRARRYALIGAVLHPYGYVLDHCAEQLRHVSAVERQRDVDELQTGQKPFDLVHLVLARVAEDSPNTSADLLARGLGRLRAALQPSAGFDSASFHGSRLQ